MVVATKEGNRRVSEESGANRDRMVDGDERGRNSLENRCREKNSKRRAVKRRFLNCLWVQEREG